MELNPDDIKVRVVYRGNCFTLAEAMCEIDTLNGHKRLIRAEAIARRSSVDAPDPKLGEAIAQGRAIRALHKKALGERIHHHFMG